ncbi:MAG TPA: DUF4157 domain-containing protein [Stellaceae bacterium]|nr:DUF4157 domain-containing protein [Stellaceae bacterium]
MIELTCMLLPGRAACTLLPRRYGGGHAMRCAIQHRSTEAHKGAVRAPMPLSGYRTRFGNQAALRRLATAAPRLQAKLAVGPVDDPLEQEAERVADQVTAVQRKCAECADEDASKLQAKQASASIGAATAPASIHDTLRAPGEKLEGSTREFMEPRFGHDFGDVRIHRDAAAAASARQVNATAYTVGRDIVFDSGRYAPATAEGVHLLAHELTHVVQQRAAAPRVARQPAGNDPEKADAPQAPAPDGGDSGAAQPMAGASKDCLDRCEQQFDDCRKRGDPMSCLAARSVCLRACEPPSAEKPKPAPAPDAAKPAAPAAKTAPYVLSDSGKAFIKLPLIEGFCPNLYDDDTFGCRLNPEGKGNCTIFVGQLVHRGPCRPGEVAPRDQTESRFANALNIVNDNVNVALSQNQVDALVSFTFNANVGGIQVLAPTLNKGDFAAMPDLIRKTKTNGGVLVPRRNREANLFANGDYQPKK